MTDRSWERDLGELLLRLAIDGPLPADGAATTIPADVYTSPERHRRELALMRTRPVAAVPSSSLATNGSFVTAQLLGIPVIVVRDASGQVRAMHNACAHRGATVELRDAGTARIWSCGFHGWSYDLDGSLRSVSDAKLFSSEECTTGLRPLQCDERHGIVWVTPDATAPVQSVEEWLGPEIDDLLGLLGLAEMSCHATTQYDVACNWKMLTDGFLELYHLKYLHRSSIAPYFPANGALPLRFGGHFGMALPKNRLVRALADSPQESWDVLSGLTLPVVLVPGTVLQWQAGHVELFSFRPDLLDPARTVCHLSMLVPSDRAADTALWDRNWERVCATIPAEDFAVAEQVQANINAGVVDSIQVGRNEHVLVEHLAALDAAMASVEPFDCRDRPIAPA